MVRTSAHLAVAAALALGVSASEFRATTSFDFGWKQKEGIDEPIAKCDFPVNESTYRCDGLQAANAQNALEVSGNVVGGCCSQVSWLR
jgi:hypothetical protein